MEQSLRVSHGMLYSDESHSQWEHNGGSGHWPFLFYPLFQAMPLCLQVRKDLSEQTQYVFMSSFKSHPE